MQHLVDCHENEGGYLHEVGEWRKNENSLTSKH